MKLAVSLGCGALFGFGLALSGMTDPARVLGFLDVAGRWDPTLAFVMAGALGVNAVAFALTRRRSGPLLGDRFHLPARGDVDLPLVAGSALFGVGWGLAGFCPGPGLAALATGAGAALLFVGGLLAGTLLGRLRRPES